MALASDSIFVVLLCMDYGLIYCVNKGGDGAGLVCGWCSCGGTLEVSLMLLTLHFGF